MCLAMHSSCEFFYWFRFYVYKLVLLYTRVAMHEPKQINELNGGNGKYSFCHSAFSGKVCLARALFKRLLTVSGFTHSLLSSSSVSSSSFISFILIVSALKIKSPSETLMPISRRSFNA